MKQVKFRSVLLLLLIVLLGLGLALFCLRYTFRGEAWASFSANGHAYTDGVVRTGQVLDRNGTVLYDGPSGVYHEDSALRQATLHAVGDQLGNISTSALEAFQSRLIGFDPLTGTLSGGQRQALTLLMATLRKPKLLLLDEHTAALDPKTAAKVMELTERMVTEEKLSALMITHNMRDAIRYGNRLIMLHAGRIILDISGQEKKELTVPELLEMFARASGDEFSGDRAILA